VDVQPPGDLFYLFEFVLVLVGLDGKELLEGGPSSLFADREVPPTDTFA